MTTDFYKIELLNKLACAKLNSNEMRDVTFKGIDHKSVMYSIISYVVCNLQDVCKNMYRSEIAYMFSSEGNYLSKCVEVMTSVFGNLLYTGSTSRSKNAEWGEVRTTVEA